MCWLVGKGQDHTFRLGLVDSEGPFAHSSSRSARACVSPELRERPGQGASVGGALEAVDMTDREREEGLGPSLEEEPARLPGGEARRLVSLPWVCYY